MQNAKSLSIFKRVFCKLMLPIKSKTGGLSVINTILIALSIVIYANIAKDMLSLNIASSITYQQFLMSLIFYILSVILGLGIQIGGGIDG